MSRPSRSLVSFVRVLCNNLPMVCIYITLWRCSWARGDIAALIAFVSCSVEVVSPVVTDAAGFSLILPSWGVLSVLSLSSDSDSEEFELSVFLCCAEDHADGFPDVLSWGKGL